MSILRRVSVAALFTLACVPSFGAGQGTDACALTAPPKDAQLTVGRAGNLRTYPPSVPPRYTGCRVTWQEDGHRLLSVSFQAGRVREVDLQEPGKAASHCVFSQAGTLTKGDEEHAEHRRIGPSDEGFAMR